MSAPLDGVRVVEAATFMAAPYAAMQLADLGADVIKVEPPKGDPFRRFNRPSTYVAPVFANCNRGKRSMVLDLKTDAGKEHMLGLVARADVFITNWRPPVVRSLGLDDDVLAARSPRLIRVYVSGFGPTGPRADDPVFDTIVQARSGMTHALTTGDDPPRLQPGYPVDKYTGVVAAQAVLAALFARERRPGRVGERLDVAMLDATAYVNFPELFVNRTFVDHQPAEARNVGGTSLRAVRTADGWIICGAVSGEQIRNACAAVGHPEWGSEVLAIKDAVSMVAEFFDRIESVTSGEPTAVWVERFGAVDVPAAKLLEMDEHLADEQVVHNRIYAIEDWEGVGPVRGPRYPGVFSSSELLTGQGRAPALGEHTEEVLKELA